MWAWEGSIVGVLANAFGGAKARPHIKSTNVLKAIFDQYGSDLSRGSSGESER